MARGDRLACEWAPDGVYSPHCPHPAKFVMICQRSGYTYEVCGVHRRTSERIGDEIVCAVGICTTCAGTGVERRFVLGVA